MRPRSGFWPGARWRLCLTLLGHPRPTPLRHCPTRRDWPQALDARSPNADVPVVTVDGRVAMAGLEPELLAEARRLPSPGDDELPMLIGRPCVGHTGTVPHDRGTAVERQRLEARVDDRKVAARRAHDRRQHEERLCRWRGLVIAPMVA